MAISLFDPLDPLTRPFSPMPGPPKFPSSKKSMWDRLGLSWLGKDSRRSVSPDSLNCNHQTPYNDSSDISSLSAKYNNNNNINPPKSVLRNVRVSLPRLPILKRRNSERYDRLYRNEAGRSRALSVDRRRPFSGHRNPSAPPVSTARLSAPDVRYHDKDLMFPSCADAASLYAPEHFESGTYTDAAFSVNGEDLESMLEKELDKKWVLNLSMHFRDQSDREKFFITYAETPNKWRRVTVSCDYRNAELDSLEQDLKSLYYQRDKSARIYESIRDSICEIQFYNTVTNLKLETIDGRLHVHVTEDMNEIVPYPPSSTVAHLGLHFVRESELFLDTHLSGFAFQVKLNNKFYVKKEVPAPESVDEFLYEINALHALSGSQCVIELKAIVVDDNMMVVKGLLINFADQGALVDLFYENKGVRSVEWARRERWARQTIQGLAEIHEAGFVQGDFTLSNIVIDDKDDAKIIDINRRGCPVGWEAPEFTKKLESNQKISMYIGVKSDLYQLGMTLWALATEEDDPGKQFRPFVIPTTLEIPDYYRHVVDICLSARPQDRLSAKELLNLFPEHPPTMASESAAVNVEPSPSDPMQTPRDPGFLDENLPRRIDVANDAGLISGPRPVPISEDVPLYDSHGEKTTVDNHHLTTLASLNDVDLHLPFFESSDMGARFENPDFGVNGEAILAAPPSSVTLSSRVHGIVPLRMGTFVAPEVLTCIGWHGPYGTEVNSVQLAEPHLSGDLPTSQPCAEGDESETYRDTSEVDEEAVLQVQVVDSETKIFEHTNREDLLGSSLPINPAYKDPPVSKGRNIGYSNRPSFDTSTLTKPTATDLSTCLPRDQDLQTAHFENLFLSNLSIDLTFKELSEQVQEDNLLLTSNLPINPAFKDHSELSQLVGDPPPHAKVNRNFDFFNATSQPPTVPEAQSSMPHVFLLSQLPINQDFGTPFALAREVSYAPPQGSNDEPGSPSVPTKKFCPSGPEDGLNRTSCQTDLSEDLLKHELPNNPAFQNLVGPRLLRGLSIHPPLEENPEQLSYQIDRSDDLLMSQLPINPSFKDPVVPGLPNSPD
ncbi:TKL protein kinase [Paracoccidioides brasiliensis Pb18]|uniref:non-specific serine/threonine protein kinase n=1 Tax=Paracoccidioides brasiliensis (strain Pb18) TaxID=502780 RepID=C1G7T5_PARBD|nr:TKL protein kinase [Paracoccidioides brasiliensis Pb18]EEH47142.2 TKL protein kinase [Paracoccidioides brasiliensis Pb18]